MGKITTFFTWGVIIIVVIHFMNQIMIIEEISHESRLGVWLVLAFITIMTFMSISQLSMVGGYDSSIRFLLTSPVAGLILIFAITGIMIFFFGKYYKISIFEGIGIEILGAFITASMIIFIDYALSHNREANKEIKLMKEQIRSYEEETQLMKKEIRIAEEKAQDLEEEGQMLEEDIRVAEEEYERLTLQLLNTFQTSEAHNKDVMSYISS
jgi:hypothetical protein